MFNQNFKYPKQKVQLLNGKTADFEPPYTFKDAQELHRIWGGEKQSGNIKIQMGEALGLVRGVEYETLKLRYKGQNLTLINRGFPFYYGRVSAYCDTLSLEMKPPLVAFCLHEDYHKDEKIKRPGLSPMQTFDFLTK